VDQLTYLDDSLKQLKEIIERKVGEAADPPTHPPPVQQVFHIARTGRRGRPRIEIDTHFLQHALELRTPTHIGRPLANVSGRTVRRRAIDYGIREQRPPVRQRVQQEDGTVLVIHGHLHQIHGRGVPSILSNWTASSVMPCNLSPILAVTCSAATYKAKGFT
jgi:hypothetical protein